VVVGVWYRGRVYLHWVVWFLLFGIVMGVICIGLWGCCCVVSWWVSSHFGSVFFFGVWYRVGCHLPLFVWLLVCGIVVGFICLGLCVLLVCGIVVVVICLALCRFLCSGKLSDGELAGLNASRLRES